MADEIFTLRQDSLGELRSYLKPLTRSQELCSVLQSKSRSHQSQIYDSFIQFIVKQLRKIEINTLTSLSVFRRSYKHVR